KASRDRSIFSQTRVKFDPVSINPIPRIAGATELSGGTSLSGIPTISSRLFCPTLALRTNRDVCIHFVVHAETFTARVIGITDGDALTVLIGRQEMKIRLADIKARESKQAFGAARSRINPASCRLTRRPV